MSTFFWYVYIKWCQAIYGHHGSSKCEKEGSARLWNSNADKYRETNREMASLMHHLVDNDVLYHKRTLLFKLHFLPFLSFLFLSFSLNLLLALWYSTVGIRNVWHCQAYQEKIFFSLLLPSKANFSNFVFFTSSVETGGLVRAESVLEEKGSTNFSLRNFFGLMVQ